MNPKVDVDYPLSLGPRDFSNCQIKIYENIKYICKLWKADFDCDAPTTYAVIESVICRVRDIGFRAIACFTYFGKT